jgi:hypothetical protein
MNIWIVICQKCKCEYTVRANTPNEAVKQALERHALVNAKANPRFRCDLPVMTEAEHLHTRARPKSNQKELFSQGNYK